MLGPETDATPRGRSLAQELQARVQHGLRWDFRIPLYQDARRTPVIYTRRASQGSSPTLTIDQATGTPSSFGREALDLQAQILGALSPHLPARFYAHLSPALHLDDGWAVEHESGHQKMLLTDKSRLADLTGAVPLGPADLPAVLDLYTRAYPGNWFIPRMLETGAYRGIWRGGQLVAAAGVHVWAPVQGVAALGNITVDHAFRGRGLGAVVTSAVCLGLAPSTTHIGLNVHADNAVAIGCYTRLGFRHVADYHERLIQRRGG